MMRFAIVALLLLGSGLPAHSATPFPPADLPREQVAGPFASGHVQGIAVDRKGGFIYYSFTDMLAKYDFEGRLVGTLTGWSGHLGDLDFNPVDGRVYGSLEYGKQDAFYIAMIDGPPISMATARRIIAMAVQASMASLLAPPSAGATARST
jgi:hypothetical protein